MNMFRAFMELDEAYNERQSLIDRIKKAGKTYNFDKYTDAQLYRIAQRLQQPRVATKEPKHDLDLDFETRELEYCECGTRLSDAGLCPVCDDGEEDLKEGIFDSKPSNRSSWVPMTRKPTNTASSTSPAAQPSQTATTPNAAAVPNKYYVRIVSHNGRLRALATDGTNPAAWVAFPNDLRQYEGQQYEVDQLIWNGKNYRVAGNIVEI